MITAGPLGPDYPIPHRILNVIFIGKPFAAPEIFSRTYHIHGDSPWAYPGNAKALW